MASTTKLTTFENVALHIRRAACVTRNAQGTITIGQAEKLRRQLSDLDNALLGIAMQIDDTSGD